MKAIIHCYGDGRPAFMGTENINEADRAAIVAYLTRAAAVSRLTPQLIEQKEDRGTRVDGKSLIDGQDLPQGGHELTVNDAKRTEASALLTSVLMDAWLRHPSTRTGEWGKPSDVYFSVEKAVDVLTPVLLAARLPPAPAPQLERLARRQRGSDRRRQETR